MIAKLPLTPKSTLASLRKRFSLPARPSCGKNGRSQHRPAGPAPGPAPRGRPAGGQRGRGTRGDGATAQAPNSPRAAPKAPAARPLPAGLQRFSRASCSPILPSDLAARPARCPQLLPARPREGGPAARGAPGSPGSLRAREQLPSGLATGF